MKVQGRLMLARFIEIHQVFAKISSDTFIIEWYMQTKLWIKPEMRMSSLSEDRGYPLEFHFYPETAKLASGSSRVSESSLRGRVSLF